MNLRRCYQLLNPFILDVDSAHWSRRLLRQLVFSGLIALKGHQFGTKWRLPPKKKSTRNVHFYFSPLQLLHEKKVESLLDIKGLVKEEDGE